MSACSDYLFLVPFLVDSALHGVIEKPGLAGERDGEAIINLDGEEYTICRT